MAPGFENVIGNPDSAIIYASEEKILIHMSSFLKWQMKVNNVNKRHTLLYSLIP